MTTPFGAGAWMEVGVRDHRIRYNTRERPPRGSKGSITYTFCDDSVVVKRPNGSMSLKTSQFSRHPRYEAYTERARANLEVAEHNAKVLKTPVAHRRAAKANAVFERRVAKFRRKYAWPKERYYRAVRRSKLRPVEKT